MKDLKVVEKTAYAEKSTTKRTENRLSIFSGTPPTTAAQKIREKFGEQFAKELKEAL
jgi:hypothetical protein